MGVTGWPLLDEALDRWESRSPMSRRFFDQLPDWAKARAFTAARMAGDHALEELQKSLGKALLEGKTLREWISDDYERIANKYGRPGANRAAYEDLLFRTNQQAALMAGQYAESFSPEWMEMAPYWMYSAIDDGRTRPMHRALDGKVFRKDDPLARRYLPPLGFNCRCQTIEMTEDDVKDQGLDVLDGARIPFLEHDGKPLGPPPEGWNADRVAALVPDFMRRVGMPSRETVIERISDEIRGLDYEVGAAIHRDGRVLFTVKGDIESIELTPKQATLMEDTVFVHNHPRGSPPSLPVMGKSGDLGVAAEVDADGIRVVGTLGGKTVDYSIERPEAGWNLSGLRSFTSEAWVLHEGVDNVAKRTHLVLEMLHRFGVVIYGRKIGGD